MSVDELADCGDIGVLADEAGQLVHPGVSPGLSCLVDQQVVDAAYAAVQREFGGHREYPAAIEADVGVFPERPQ